MLAIGADDWLAFDSLACSSSDFFIETLSLLLPTWKPFICSIASFALLGLSYFTKPENLLAV